VIWIHLQDKIGKEIEEESNAILSTRISIRGISKHE
jgi:hypothetical protein